MPVELRASVIAGYQQCILRLAPGESKLEALLAGSRLVPQDLVAKSKLLRIAY